MPTRDELIAHGRDDGQIRQAIGADALIYQSLEGMKRSVSDINPALTRFEASCFDGDYITGDVSPQYLEAVAAGRTPVASAGDDEAGRSQMNLQFAVAND
jgi:amidophosphoribosyltransferase